MFIKNNYGTQCFNRPRHLFHSFRCTTWHIFEPLHVYMNPALIWINIVLYCYSVVVFVVTVVADPVIIVITVAVFAIVVAAAVVWKFTIIKTVVGVTAKAV